MLGQDLKLRLGEITPVRQTLKGIYKMTLDEIKQAIDNGKKVFWSNMGYEVVKDKRGQYNIVFKPNNHCIGLTWLDNVTLNGKEEDFFQGE